MNVAELIARLRCAIARPPECGALREPPAFLPDHWQPHRPNTPVPECQAPTDGPLVSVVTVCKNAAPFIGRAISSVRAQTYRNIEHVIQDGQSTDGTLDAIAADGLTVVSERDQCTLDGLFKAARRSRGEYVAICWADDELLPHAVAASMLAITQACADVVYGDHIVDRQPAGHAFIARSAPWDNSRFLQGEFFPSFPSSFYRREVLLRLGERLTIFDHDEWEYWALLDRLGVIRYRPGINAIFHVHDRTRWMGDAAADYVAHQVEGRRRAIVSLDLPGDVRRRAEMGTELWAALHLTGWAQDALPAICAHTERALAVANGDYRFRLLLDRILIRLPPL